MKKGCSNHPHFSFVQNCTQWLNNLVPFKMCCEDTYVADGRYYNRRLAFSSLGFPAFWASFGGAPGAPPQVMQGERAAGRGQWPAMLQVAMAGVVMVDHSYDLCMPSPIFPTL